MEKSGVLFSIVIPVFNVGNELIRCLDSLINDGYTDYEVILVDDGSTDGITANICDEYVKKYPFFFCVHKKNEGCVFARKDGALLARGRYLTFCDGDDYVSKSYLNSLHTAVEHDADIYCLNNYLNYEGRQEFYVEKQNLTTGYATLGWLQEKIFTVQMAAVWDKIYNTEKFVNAIGQATASINFGEDAYINACYIQNTDKVYVQNTADYYHFVDSPTSVCANDIKIKRLYEIDVQYNSIVQLIQSSKRNDLLDRFMQTICGMYFRTLASLVVNGESKKLLKESMNQQLVYQQISLWKPKRMKDRIYRLLVKEKAFGAMKFLVKVRGEKWKY